MRTRSRSRYLASIASRLHRVHGAAMLACDPTSPRSGHGKRGCTSRVKSGAAWALSRAGKKLLWKGQLHCPVARRLCQARGSRLLAIQVQLVRAARSTFVCCPQSLAVSLDCRTRLMLCSAVRRSTNAALTPLTLCSNSTNSFSSFGGEGASATVLSPADSYGASCMAAYGHVQNARPLMPGQPLPQGVAAFCLATPMPHQHM